MGGSLSACFLHPAYQHVKAVQANQTSGRIPVAEAQLRNSSEYVSRLLATAARAAALCLRALLLLSSLSEPVAAFVLERPSPSEQGTRVYAG